MDSIARLMEELPEGYEALSAETGAFKMKRGITGPTNLMKLALFHLHNGSTLIATSEIARLTQLGEISDVAFMKRFEHCGEWFKAINKMLTIGALINYSKPLWMEGLNVLAVDASDVTEKGRSGRTFRLHYALNVFQMVSVQHKITESSVGESLCNFTFAENDLVMADRAYSTIKSISHCEECGAKYLIRMRKQCFTLRDESGERIDMVSRLCALGDNDILDVTAYATNSSGEQTTVRVCAKRKTPEGITASRKRIKRTASKKQICYSDDAITFNDYIVLITNLSGDIPAESILGAYRLRWQVEIHFKRLKSILNCGDLPKRRNGSTIAWLNGKIMLSLLIEKMLSGLVFPPTGYGGPKYLEGGEVPCASRGDELRRFR